jgi:lipoprotein signal peptidase
MPSRRFGTGAFARGWIGLVVAALVLLFDQLSKFWALEALQQPPRMIEVTSFFNLLIDRLRFRAVVDFLDFHAGSYHWPTFNIADSAITVGILCLAVHSLLIPRKRLR